MKLSIIIPAHNEEKRIRRTLRSYHRFFDLVREQDDINFELLVVLNGCTDDTYTIVEEMADEYNTIRALELEKAGKGLAVREGFRDALKRKNDLIGFVDADAATQPEHFYDLVLEIDTGIDGVIASRYMPGAKVEPPRPVVKRWGSSMIYEPLVRYLFGLKYHDLQCGAKVFKKEVIKKVVPEMSVDQWMFDVELLYLCKKHGFAIKEHPTTWHDQEGSKLSVGSAGLGMIWDLFSLWRRIR